MSSGASCSVSYLTSACSHQTHSINHIRQRKKGRGTSNRMLEVGTRQMTNELHTEVQHRPENKNALSATTVLTKAAVCEREPAPESAKRRDHCWRRLLHKP